MGSDILENSTIVDAVSLYKLMQIIGHLVHFVHIFVRTPRDFWRKVSGSSPRFQASAMCTSGHAPDRPTAGTRTKLSSTRDLQEHIAPRPVKPRTAQIFTDKLD